MPFLPSSLLFDLETSEPCSFQSVTNAETMIRHVRRRDSVTSTTSGGDCSRIFAGTCGGMGRNRSFLTITDSVLTTRPRPPLLHRSERPLVLLLRPNDHQYMLRTIRSPTREQPVITHFQQPTAMFGYKIFIAHLFLIGHQNC